MPRVRRSPDFNGKVEKKDLKLYDVTETAFLYDTIVMLSAPFQVLLWLRVKSHFFGKKIVLGWLAR